MDAHITQKKEYTTSNRRNNCDCDTRNAQEDQPNFRRARKKYLRLLSQVLLQEHAKEARATRLISFLSCGDARGG